MEAIVVSVSCDPDHNFSKQAKDSIVLTAGLGVEGDAHSGSKVQHRTLVRKDPTRPNTRQVHLIHSELFEELRAAGFNVAPPIWEKTFLQRELTCSDCRPGLVCTSADRRSSRSPDCAILVNR